MTIGNISLVKPGMIGNEVAAPFWIFCLCFVDKIFVVNFGEEIFIYGVSKFRRCISGTEGFEVLAN